MPIVLIGDFNMTPYDPTISLLKERASFVDSAFEEVKRGRMLGTYGSPLAERIDYVFVQSEYFNVLEAALVAEEHHRASDHLAYYTVIEWK
jgi:endonuclease/exonuclease/phosphatase family metal-dependent hydrolase